MSRLAAWLAAAEGGGDVGAGLGRDGMLGRGAGAAGGGAAASTTAAADAFAPFFPLLGIWDEV